MHATGVLDSDSDLDFVQCKEQGLAKRQNIPNEVVFNVTRASHQRLPFFLFMTMAGVLTTVAFLANSIPILIGAMVVAPILAPIQQISFGLVGGQPKTAIHGLGLTLGGLVCTIIATLLTCWIFDLTSLLPDARSEIFRPLLEERVRPGWYSIVVAIAAGMSGTIAIAYKKIDALIGVVSAVALVPAASAGAISWFAGDLVRAVGGFSYLLINILLIVGTAILTIVAFGRTIDAGEVPAAD